MKSASRSTFAMVYAQRRIATSAPMRTRRRPSGGSSPSRRVRLSNKRRKDESTKVLTPVRRCGELIEQAADGDREDEPENNQRDVHVRELSWPEAQPLCSGEHEPRRKHISEAHEEGVVGLLRFVLGLAGRRQVERISCRVLQRVVDGVLRQLGRADERQQGKERHPGVADEGHRRENQERDADPEILDYARNEKRLEDRREHIHQG